MENRMMGHKGKWEDGKNGKLGDGTQAMGKGMMGQNGTWDDGTKWEMEKWEMGNGKME